MAGPWAPSWLSLLAGQLTPGPDAGVNGSGDLALFNGVSDVVADGAGHLYVADPGNDVIRAVDLTTGLVTILAGQAGVSGSHDGATGATSTLKAPAWLAYDGAGFLYVTSADNTIRKITIANGAVTTVVGTPGNSNCGPGTGSGATFYLIGGLTYDGQGHLYVADTGCQTILNFDTTSWAGTVVAGSDNPNVICQEVDGSFATAQFSNPSTVAYDGNGHLFVTDTGASFCTGSLTGGSTIRELDLATKMVNTLAGTPGQIGSSDGVGGAASFSGPTGIAYDGNGNLYIADSLNDTIREIDIASQTVTTVAGSVGVTGSTDGVGLAALFDTPGGLSVDQSGLLYIADANTADIREYTPATGVVTTVAGSPETSGSANSNQGTTRFVQPSGIVYDGVSTLYVSDTGNHTIRQVDINTGMTTAFVGSPGQAGYTDGTGAAALFTGGGSLTLGPPGYLYATNGNDNETIRMIDIATAKVTTVAGTPNVGGCGTGTGAAAQFSALGALWYDGSGHLYGADSFCFRIVELDTSTWTETKIAGSTTSCAYADGPALQAAFSYAGALASDGLGNLYIVDSGASFCTGTGETVRKLDLSTMVVSTIAGQAGVLGSQNGIGAAATFNYPNGVGYDGVGALFIADGNSIVRRLEASRRARSAPWWACPGRRGSCSGPSPPA